MKIHEHLAVEKISAAAWGRIVGLSRMQALRAVKGEVVPRKGVVVKTYVWSRGRVTPDDWYDLPDLASLLADPAPGAQAAA
jgi:hypothetical protein